MTSMTSLYFVPAILVIFFDVCYCLSGHGGNAPPILTVNRNWRVQDNEPIGSIVARVEGFDGEGDPLRYGLERNNDFNMGAADDTRPLPFTIDPESGLVKTNQSLIDWAGQNFLLYVTVTDGGINQKTAVWVNIMNSSAPARPYSNTPPFPGHPGAPKLVPPSPPYAYPPKPVIIDKPKIQNSTTLPETKSSTTSPIPTTVPTTIQTTTNMKLTPSTTTTTDAPETTTTSPPIPSPVAPAPSVMDLALTIVPVAIICIMFGVAGIAVILFRKRLCKKYKASKKNSSETKKNKKKKDGSREDSMVMQQWSGPVAHSNRYEPWNDSSMPPPAQPAPEPPEKPADRWEYPRHQLKVFNILGEGCFGQVWKCQANNIDGNEGPTIVAVKTLKENAGERERTDLLQELQVMKTLEPHPNVVRLIGCCTDKDPIFVIMEYVSKGKLQGLLRNSRALRCYDNLHGKSATLTSRNLTSFCYQVARGMHFLSNKGIIHRDLAARNVLVSDDMTCKVADFGFARDVLASHIYERKSEGRLPIRWMAPESLYDNLFSVKSDVWSFGVLIWEVVTLGSTPYPGLSAGEVMKRVRDGYRLDKPEHCRRELYNIMYYCWHDDPAKRPDFPEITSLLEQLLLSETDYIELQHFPDHSYYNIVSLSGEKL